MFQFGAGRPRTSNKLMLNLSTLQGECLILGCHVVAAQFPFLGSLTTLNFWTSPTNGPTSPASTRRFPSTCLRDTWLSASSSSLMMLPDVAHGDVWIRLEEAGLPDPEVNLMMSDAAAAMKDSGNSEALAVSHHANGRLCQGR